MKKTSFILISLVFIFLGCGGKEKIKPSADSIIAQKTIYSLELIRNAYQNKDKTTIHGNVASALSEEISKTLFFEKADLSFTPQMVKIKGSKVTVHVNWQGVWTVKGKTLKNRGVAMFVFGSSPMKLINIDGDNPFHIP